MRAIPLYDKCNRLNNFLLIVVGNVVFGNINSSKKLSLTSYQNIAAMPGYKL